MTFRDYESELREAGWKPHLYRGKERLTMWVDPEDGKVYRGPYFAWEINGIEKAMASEGRDGGREMSRSWKCDRCKNYYETDPPNNWINVDGYDLCSTCYQAFVDFMNPPKVDETESEELKTNVQP
jgi:hypothetical protein